MTGHPGGRSPSRWVAGVDGCRAGWLVVLAPAAVDDPSPPRVELLPAIAPLLVAVRDGALGAVAVDMPIGLPGSAPRASDAAARRFLGPRRATIFPTPPRAVLGASSYAEALAAARAASGRGISRQAWNLVPRIRELDALLTPELQPAVSEAHPECTFAALAGSPLPTTKRTIEGAAERAGLLVDVVGDPGALLARRPSGAAPHDVLDAAALVWTARRLVHGEASWLGDPVARDARGFRMVVAV